MEALKLKIFDVLTEKIAVSEFENWLYNSEEFMNQIDSNSFYFDVISINYKDEKWQKQLDDLTRRKYDEDFMILYNIERCCIEILESQNPEKIYQILSKLVHDFDYDTDYNILWEFYSMKDYYELFKEGFCPKYNLLQEAKFYATQVIYLTKNCKNFEETKKALTKDLKPNEDVKKEKVLSLKQKILAFFKKI